MTGLSAVTAHAQSQTAASTPTKATTKAPYSEVIFSESTNDPKAVDLVTKLIANDIKSYKDATGNAAHVYAQFIALGPNQPKTAIAAYISHQYICGISGCRMLIFMPVENNKYRIVLDEIFSRMFVNLREGKEFLDVLAYVSPRPVPGFGVYFWSDKKRLYEFVGVNKFKQ